MSQENNNRKIEQEIRKNKVLARVQNLLIAQTGKGLEKYGETVQPAHLKVTDWIDHASEETTDLLVYLQVFREKVQEQENELHQLRKLVGDIEQLITQRMTALYNLESSTVQEFDLVSRINKLLDEYLLR